MFKTYIALLIIVASCSYSTTQIIKVEGNIKLQRVEYSQLTNWKKDNHKLALKSFLNSCEVFKKMPEEASVGGNIKNIKVKDFNDVCNIASLIKYSNSGQIRNFFENWFVPFKVSSRGGNDVGKFTGYFEPTIEGSMTKGDLYKYPVYSRPSDYEKYDREDIENNALKGRNLELLYVKDNIDLFFMHIQGTGKITLEDGRQIKLSYDGKNNKPYRSIGKYIKRNNVIENNDYSYSSIKSWLGNNPKKAREIMNLNRSYIFFKISKNSDVLGAQTAKLSKERSLAIDSDLLPYGYPIWVEVNSDNINFNKLLVTQDTGSAIKGPVRGDIYFGGKKESERLAANMHNYGSYYIFLPANIIY